MNELPASRVTAGTATPLCLAAISGHTARGATPSAKTLTNAREHTDRDPECRQKTGRIAAVPLGAGATAGAEQVIRHLPEQDDPGTEAKNQA
ncbi:hypothetical protein ACFPJ8_40715 [Streptomyces fildesensis]|uniref:hypothetical protein n=1 Tax=Streptomyces fildesensis TaxID=375757 RepID=UPI00360FC8F6